MRSFDNESKTSNRKLFDEGELAIYLLDIGNGSISVAQNLGDFQIKLHSDPCFESGTLSVVGEFVNVNFETNSTNTAWLANRTIVNQSNEAVQFANNC